MSTSVEDYQLEIKKLKETIEQNNQILHNAGKEGKELLERNSNLEEQIQQIHVDYSKTIEQLEQDKYSLKSRLDLLESSTKRLEQLVNEEKEVWKTKCERRITNLEKSHHSEILVYKQQTSELQSELDEARLVQQQQEERVNRQDEIIQQLRAKQEAIHNESYTSEVELSQENEKLKSKMLKLEEEFNFLRHTLERTSLQLETTKQNLLEVENQKQKIQSECESYCNQLEHCRSEKHDIQSELDAIQFQAMDPNSRGNSLFAEVDDRRTIAEKNLISAQTKLKCMSKKFEQQVKYSIQLKAKVAQLLDTRGGDADVDRIRRLEASLSDAHADLNNALVKVAKLESQLGQELSMKVGQMATTDSPNQDKITFLQELLNKKKVEMEEMRRELDQSRFHLRAESVKSSGVERELYDAKREAEVWKRKIIKLDVDVRRLKLKCGEEVQQKPLVKKGNVEIIGDCDITEKENISSEIKTSTPTSDAQAKLGSDAHLKPKQASVPTECKQQ